MKQVNTTITETATFIKANITKTRMGRKCVDGRYPSSVSIGMIARPGGDAGYVLALLALSEQKGIGLSAGECFSLVYDTVHSEGHFGMHTDDHSENSIGCGHLAKAADDSLCGAYGITSASSRELIAYAKKMVAKKHAIDFVSLPGNHSEKGVLIIDSDTYTVNASDENGTMYFIYDRKRDDAFIRSLVKKINRIDITYESLKAISDQQLNATLHLLAKGLPLYTVTFLGETPTVSFMGDVT